MSYVVCTKRISDTYFVRFFRKESVAKKYMGKMNKRFGPSYYHVMDKSDYDQQVDKWVNNPFTIAMAEHNRKEWGF